MGKFQRNLKIYKWWNCQVPVMSIAVYYQLICAEATPNLGRALITMLLYLVTIIGVAGYGQLMNDLCDREQDERTGTHNLLVGKNKSQIAFRFFLILAVGFAPWIWLPGSSLIYALVCLEVVLLTVYSVPPIRLKTRGILGVLVDASYAYSIPVLVSMLVFGRLCSVTIPFQSLLLIFVWATAEGIFGISNHQLQDEKRDREDKIDTFVTRFGWEPTFRLISRWLLPLQVTLFLALIFYIGVRVPLVIIGYVVYVVWMLYRKQTFGIWRTMDLRRLPEKDRVFFIDVILIFQFYIQWLPLLLLMALAWRTPIYTIWLFLHLWLFQNGFTALVKWELPEMRRMRQWI